MTAPAYGAGLVTVRAEPFGGYTVEISAFGEHSQRYAWTARGAKRIAHRARRRLDRKYARYLANARRAEEIQP